MSHRGWVCFFARFILGFPRFVLLAMVFLLPAEEDRFSLDAWLPSR